MSPVLTAEEADLLNETVEAIYRLSEVCATLNNNIVDLLNYIDDAEDTNENE